MTEFNFRYAGFRTVYKAVPKEQTYAIYATSRDGNKEFTNVYLEQSEMQQMLAAGKILKMFDKEEENEVA